MSLPKIMQLTANTARLLGYTMNLKQYRSSTGLISYMEVISPSGAVVSTRLNDLPAYAKQAGNETADMLGEYPVRQHMETYYGITINLWGD